MQIKLVYIYLLPPGSWVWGRPVQVFAFSNLRVSGFAPFSSLLAMQATLGKSAFERYLPALWFRSHHRSELGGKLWLWKSYIVGLSCHTASSLGGLGRRGRVEMVVESAPLSSSSFITFL